MKASELKELTVDELAHRGKEARDELFSAKVKHATGQLEDTAKLRGLKRDVARIETVLREKAEAQK